MDSNATAPSPALDEDTRALVRRCLSAGLVEIDDVKKVVVSLMAEDIELTPGNLIGGLKGAGVLTAWQGNKLLSGASKGFYLGNYRLLRPLGRGGMGVVYLGEHHVMKRQMALKILPPDSSDPNPSKQDRRSSQNSRRIELFKAEAQACAQLDHENIVRAYDFGEASGKLYIVMEFVDGIDLGIAVSRDGVMEPAAAVNVLTQACAGLAHAHERGIVHRDIKPSNLLLRSDGLVKVSDLGLARIGFENKADDRGKRLMGTADYLAPEQAIDSQTVDSRADIYALGCTLFYLLTGSPPYEGETIHKTLAKHQTAAIPDLRDHCPGCPPGLADLARRMMSKRPSDRPRSAVELLSELKRLGGSTSVGASNALAGHAHADTVVDDSGFGMTFNTSDYSTPVSGEIDFGALPSIDLGNLHPSTSVANHGATIGPLGDPAEESLPSFSSNRPASSNQSASNQSAPKNPSSPRQTLMLGIGLTLACIAMLSVVSLAYHAMTRELPKTQPVIKSVEDGKGGTVIVVGQGT